MGACDWLGAWMRGRRWSQRSPFRSLLCAGVGVGCRRYIIRLACSVLSLARWVYRRWDVIRRKLTITSRMFHIGPRNGELLAGFTCARMSRISLPSTPDAAARILRLPKFHPRHFQI